MFRLQGQHYLRSKWRRSLNLTKRPSEKSVGDPQGLIAWLKL